MQQRVEARLREMELQNAKLQAEAEELGNLCRAQKRQWAEERHEYLAKLEDKNVELQNMKMAAEGYAEVAICVQCLSEPPYFRS